MKKIKHFIYESKNGLERVIFDNQLISGSLVMILSAMLVNVGNYLYHLLMGRMLGPESYGSLSSLIAIFYLLAIPSVAVTTVVVKFTSIYKVRDDYSRLYSLFRSFSEAFLILGIIVFLFFVFARSFIAGFLNLSQVEPVVMVGTFFLFSLLTTVNNGILQGLLEFNFLAFNNVFSTLLKLIFSILFVWIGFAIGGALLGLIVSYVLPYILSLYPLRFLWKQKPQRIKMDWREISIYAGPALVAALGMTSLYSLDIILVKHFFPPFEAGLYAALSVIGKIIFFASSIVGIVMFPIISEKFEKGSRYQSILYQALILVAFSSVFLTTLYFLLPKLMIALLFGSKSAYIIGAPYLGIFAIFISLYSLANLLLQFFLSIRETKSSFLALGAAIIQGLLIWFLHEDLYQVIYSSIMTASLLLVALLIYYFLKIGGNLSVYEK